MKTHLIKMAIILIGILGVWLVYWDIADFATQGLNTGLWDFEILKSGINSIIAGIIILVGVGYYGIKVLV